MSYSISQVAQRFGLESHTLRFYEKEGIIDPGRTGSGIRTYSEEDVHRLEMIMCLKATGMPIREIKRYFNLVELGDCTLDERLKVFKEHRETVLKDIEAMEKNLKKIEGKIAWYTKYLNERKSEIEKELNALPIAK